MLDAESIIDKLGLRPHPEGGHYAETFRSSIDVMSPSHSGSRNASTAIYFLLRTGEFSALHRVRSDEIWHFYGGDPLELVMLHEQEPHVQKMRLGPALHDGEVPQAVVPANVLQGARPIGSTHGYTLCGCTVAPGFDFRDFEMLARAHLSMCFPEHVELIRALTRAPVPAPI